MRIESVLKRLIPDSWRKPESVTAQSFEEFADLVKLGQIVKVKVSEIDDMGRLNLTMNLTGERNDQEQRKDYKRPEGGQRRDGSSNFRPRSSSGPPKKRF